MNLGPVVLMVLLGIVGVIVLLEVAYWVIRLAVRHGVMDAHQRR